MEDRGLLLNVAYRLLGSVAEAEDAVQEGYARWYGLDEAERAAVTSPSAWLVTVVSRVCLDVLGSARRRRTRYVGEWLPEPVAAAEPWTGRVAAGGDPAELVALDESLGLALLVVLETMTPAERVAFVLHDVFGFRFAEVARIAGRTPGACRQLASSARRRVDRDRRHVVTPQQHARVVAAFKDAWEHGETDSLVSLLDPSAVAIADGGGVVSAPPHPVGGSAAIAALFVRVRHDVPGLAIETALVNGRVELVAKDASGAVTAVVALAAERSLVRRLWIVRDPGKLGTWRA